MKVIYFREEKEVIYFCEMLYRFQDEIKVQWKKDSDWGNELRIHDSYVTLEAIISSLTNVFLYYRLHTIIKQIIREKYFYKEMEEIERISLLTNWVLKENHYRKKLFPEHHVLQKYIHFILNNNIEEDFPIHFDSLITFGLQPLYRRLKEAVGYGIDEMKREEEHQNFIQSIREFIDHRETKTKELHIVQGKNFTFYKSNGEKYRQAELKMLMYHEPLYIIGLDENEMNVSPVITLLPEKIYIYGDHPSEAKTLTLINIFEERVTFFPKDRFPFHQHVN